MHSEAQLHIATTHTAETLLPLLEAEGLLAPAAAPPAPRHSPTLAASSYPAKRCAVLLAMEDIVQPSRLEHLLEKTHTCDLPYCDQVTQSFHSSVLRVRIRFNADPGSAFYSNADPDPAFYFNVDSDPVFNADPDPAFYINADPDPAFYFNANPDPDPESLTNTDPDLCQTLMQQKV
jgi:hypothetical protein